MEARKNEAQWLEGTTRWRISVQRDGLRRSFYSSTPGKRGKAEAERKAEKWLSTSTQRENVRFGPLWVEFLEKEKETTGTGNYRQHESMGRNWLLPRLEHKRVISITPQDWQNCIDDGFKAGLSKKTLSNLRGAVTAFFKYCRKCRIPMERPELLTIPRAAPAHKKNILQPSDLETLFTKDTVTIHGHEEPFFFIYACRFLVLTGLRPGELCGLQNSDFKDTSFDIRRSVNQYGEITAGKNDNARRSVSLGVWANATLEGQKALLRKNRIISKWVFPDENGEMLQSGHLYKKWVTYRKQHGISCSLYEMRHTMISLARADVPEQLLKMLVGHSDSMDTFGVYGHEVDGDLQRAGALLDKVFDRVIGGGL